MKYMFASDVHGSAYYCRKMLDVYKEEKAERLVLLGDLLYHGPRNDLPKEYAPKEVIAMLNDMKNEIYAVRGNCEAEVDQMVLSFPVMAVTFPFLIIPITRRIASSSSWITAPFLRRSTRLPSSS